MNFFHVGWGGWDGGVGWGGGRGVGWGWDEGGGWGNVDVCSKCMHVLVHPRGVCRFH